MNCVFEAIRKGDCCLRCHKPLPIDFEKPPRRNCFIDCPHLGPPIERDGISIKVKCGCNGKEHDQPHAAHECAIHGRCLPTLIPDDPAKWEAREESKLYRCCHGCESNPNRKAIERPDAEA